jgi:hypothetical protein
MYECGGLINIKNLTFIKFKINNYSKVKVFIQVKDYINSKNVKIQDQTYI